MFLYSVELNVLTFFYNSRFLVCIPYFTKHLNRSVFVYSAERLGIFSVQPISCPTLFNIIVVHK